MTTSMRAVLIHGYGGLERLEPAETPRPVAGPGETLVRIRAAAVNPADGKWRAGTFESFAPVTFPHILGYDIAGEVAGGVGFAPGTRVFGMLDPLVKGGYAQFVAAPTPHLAVIPDALDFNTAAAIPTAGLTGFQMAAGLEIGPGSVILITGALGAVGRFALQTAKQRGARVIAAVRADRGQEALAAGADQVVGLDVQERDGPPFDHVLDTVGGEAVGRLCRSLRLGGRIVTAATTPIPARDLAAEPEFFAVKPDGQQTRLLGEAVAAGRLAVPIAKILPLEQAREAQRLTDAGGLGGKIVLTP